MAEQTTYEKDDFCTMDGQKFEVQVLALLYLQALNLGRPFKMASNVSGAGKLDDIAFKFQDKEQRWSICYCQLKHIRNKENKEKKLSLRKFIQKNTSGFYLADYFGSFQGIKEKMKSVGVEEMFCVDDESVYFAFFTNTEWDEEEIESCSPQFPGLENTCLQTGIKMDIVLSKSENASLKSKIYKKSITAKEEDIDDFLGRLWVFHSKPDHEDIHSQIKEELKRYLLSCSVEFLDRWSKSYLDQIEKWWESPISAVILSERSSVLQTSLTQTIVDDIIGIQLHGADQLELIDERSLRSIQEWYDDNQNIRRCRALYTGQEDINNTFAVLKFVQEHVNGNRHVASVQPGRLVEYLFEITNEQGNTMKIMSLVGDDFLDENTANEVRNVIGAQMPSLLLVSSKQENLTILLQGIETVDYIELNQ